MLAETLSSLASKILYMKFYKVHFFPDSQFPVQTQREQKGSKRVKKEGEKKIQPFPLPQMDQQPINQLVLPIPRGGFHGSIFFYYASTVEFLFCLAGQSGIQSIM